MEREDINFINDVIDGALLKHSRSLDDPLAHEITELVMDRLNRKGGITNETG